MFEKRIQMVDLHGQYGRLQEEIDAAMRSVLASCAFINGPQVKAFSDHLAEYLAVPYVIPCGNGTDALEIALMALGLRPGDEVIVPAFTYIAAAEVTLALGLTPVFVDVDPRTFNLDASKIEDAITEKTRAIVAVHLFGQCCDMEKIVQIAHRYNLYVVEDNAQSIGANYTFSDGTVRKSGTIGHIGTTSFFPSKPLACYGDGGAMFTSDPVLAERLRMIANHGQKVKYHHLIVGCNSRLDTLQAAILDVKLKYIDAFTKARQEAAARYNAAFKDMENVLEPQKTAFSSHVYHQYTIQVQAEKRDELQMSLKEKGIPSMIYYPLTMPQQEVMKGKSREVGTLEVATQLCRSVLSLPIHTEMSEEEQAYIIENIKNAL